MPWRNHVRLQGLHGVAGLEQVTLSAVEHMGVAAWLGTASHLVAVMRVLSERGVRMCAKAHLHSSMFSLADCCFVDPGWLPCWYDVGGYLQNIRSLLYGLRA